MAKLMVLLSLLPQSLWKHFEEITQIPRPSGEEERMTKHVIDIAEKNNLTYKTDEWGNVVVYKPATKGCENYPTVILQSHLDMVCEKNPDVEFDFYTDPIPIEMEGDWIKTKGTTLGADDGIGVAMALNVLTSKDISHGPLECLFTTDEEMGMTGANHLSKNFLSGKMLINLDSEEEGIITVGCAGGSYVSASIPLSCKKITRKSYCFSLEISGLKGGHSGTDIHLGRANANKLAVHFLSRLAQEMPLQLVSLSGGNARNAIPRNAYIEAVVPFKMKEEVRKLLNIYTAEVEEKYKEVDPDIHFTLESEFIPEQCISVDMTHEIIKSLMECPDGMIAPYPEMGEMMKTSTNLGVIVTINDTLFISNMCRSFVLEELDEVVEKIVTSLHNFSMPTINIDNAYEPWSPDFQSKLLKVAKDTYLKQYGKEVKVSVTPGGLECGVFVTNLEGIEAISIGPNMKDTHSPSERLSISSTQRVWDYLVNLLKAIGE